MNKLYSLPTAKQDYRHDAIVPTFANAINATEGWDG